MAVRFPGGNNNFISMTAANTVTKNQSALSLMAWVQFDQINQLQTIAVYTTPTAGNTRFSIKMVATGALEIACRALDADALTSILTSSTTLITRGLWYHFAGVVSYTAPASAAIYLNGELQPLAPFTNNLGGSATSNTNGVLQRIGSSANLNTEIFGGVIEDVRLYQRVLGAAEIMTIYSARGADRILQGLGNRYMLKELGQGQNVAAADNIGTVDNLVGTTSGSIQYTTGIINARSRYRNSLTYPDSNLRGNLLDGVVDP
jgi:hypothetical protein